MIWVLYVILGYIVLKIAHGLGLCPWPHTWLYSHDSNEKHIAIDLKTNQWVDQSRSHSHSYCRYCDAWKDK